jgi:hypothetical protein
MEFDYEISADDYADAVVLYHKLSRKRTASSGWLLAGISLLVVGLIERDRGLSPILLGAVGIWWIWAGLARVFPGISLRRYYRKYYQQLSLKGKKYRANLDGNGFQVVGENCGWNYRWVDALQKGEDKRVFMLYCDGVFFIFAKRYLADEQQTELRSLAGLPAV